MSKRELSDEENAMVLQYLMDMFGGKVCPMCRTPLTGKRQVGRCVYAEPCGHRIYQGKADLGPETAKIFAEESSQE